MKYNYTCEVFLLTAAHEHVKYVVRVTPCAAQMRPLNYVQILDEILENLDCNNISLSGSCFDAASSVIKGIKLLSGYSTETSRAQAAPENSIAAVEVPKLQLFLQHPSI